MKLRFSLALIAILAAQPGAFCQDRSVKQLPTAASVSRTTLPNGGKLNHFEMKDGTICEVIQHKDKAQELTYKCVDGSQLIIKRDSSGQSTAVLIEKNGHERQLTPIGCDTRLQGQKPVQPAK